jgi:hypothetical protein
MPNVVLLVPALPEFMAYGVSNPGISNFGPPTKKTG